MADQKSTFGDDANAVSTFGDTPHGAPALGPAPPAKPPLPIGLTTGAERRQRLGLPEEEPSLLSSAASALASPITGLAGIPGQLAEFASGNRPPTGGFLSENPGEQAYGNALMTIGASTKLRSPVTVDRPSMVAPTQSLIWRLGRHFIPGPLRTVGDMVAPKGTEPVPASLWRRTHLQMPLTPDVPIPDWLASARAAREGSVTPPASPPPPDVTITPQSQFPSGRVPGTGEPRIRPVGEVNPDVQAARDLRNMYDRPTTIQPLPEAAATPQTQFPSGRVPGHLREPIQLQPVERQPIWAGFEPNLPPPELPPIQGPQPGFPSGRIPGHLKPVGEAAPPKPPESLVRLPGVEDPYTKALSKEMGERAQDAQRKAIALAKKLKELDQTPDSTSTPEARLAVSKKAGYTRPFKDKTGDLMWKLVTHEFDKLK